MCDVVKTRMSREEIKRESRRNRRRVSKWQSAIWSYDPSNFSQSQLRLPVLNNYTLRLAFGNYELYPTSAAVVVFYQPLNVKANRIGLLDTWSLEVCLAVLTYIPMSLKERTCTKNFKSSKICCRLP